VIRPVATGFGARPTPGRLSALAPAKLNVGLWIVRRRPDGYHDLLTLYQAVDLYDQLTVEPRARGLTLSCTDPTLPTDRSNLVLRAAAVLAQATGVKRGAHFHLEKRIPHGAGLGGGSSDAAAALLLLNRLWGLGLGRGRLSRLARTVGADVPYFLVGGTAVGRGRGDRLTPVQLVGDKDFVILHSSRRISAKWAYFQYKRELTASEPTPRMAKMAGMARQVGKFFNRPVNHLQPGVLAHFPDLRQNLDDLQALGAIAVSMTGSGSSVFGVFPDRPAASAAARRLRRSGKPVTLCRTVKHGVVISGDVGGPQSTW
jgi:4-diphosphocytidyl-2-C-methyl-D-erythritol kinase